MKSTQAELDTIMESDATTLKGTQWGEMAVNINRFEPGVDLSPLLAQVSTGSCPVPHWGYVIEGSWTVRIHRWLHRDDQRWRGLLHAVGS
jgi:hypothetical protein